MKPFDLEEALQGKPVQLRNGDKGIICYKVPNEYIYANGDTVNYPLKGMVLSNKGFIADSNACWCEDGRYTIDVHIEPEHSHDIIGMWEEPTPTVTLTLPKPFKPKKGEKYFTIVTKSKYDPLSIVDTYNFETPTDNDLINQGNAFKKEEDAQAWIDAMREAVCE